MTDDSPPRLQKNKKKGQRFLIEEQMHKKKFGSLQGRHIFVPEGINTTIGL